MKRFLVQLFFGGAMTATVVIMVGAPLLVSAAQRIVLDVPFTVQAPFGDWSEPWQNFCEEASVVMAAHFLWGFPITPLLADTEMRLIKQYEELAFGRHKDTSIEETAGVLQNLYGFSGIRVKSVRSADEIKQELIGGKIVVAPMAGRLLKNPFFKSPGPLYHMVVIRGFDDERKTFIVNDPGTRRGEKLSYNQSLLMNALHDWNNGDVLRGEKKVMVVGKSLDER